MTNAGESFGDTFDVYMAKDLTVMRAGGVDKTFAALLAHQADYMIIGLYPGRNEAKRLGIADKVAFLPKALVSADMYVGRICSRKFPRANGTRSCPSCK